MDKFTILCISLLCIISHALTNDILNRNDLLLKSNFNTNFLSKKMTNEIDEIGYATAAHNIESLRKKYRYLGWEC
ncbi:hypothetical protein QQG55_57040 [Brugia pahangi]